MSEKCPKTWHDDPMMWILIAIIAGVGTAIASSIITRNLNLEVQALKAKLQAQGEIE